jgi:hypothetical protein
MYIAMVALTMLLAPAGSVLIDHAIHPDAPLMALIGKWFVFWGVGVRLCLAGARQFFQPSFTAKEIFHMTSDEALPLVRELGLANLASGVVGAASLVIPSFVLPAAISAGLFYGVAGARHVAERGRSLNETVAMASDLFMGCVLAAVVVAKAMGVG